MRKELLSYQLTKLLEHIRDLRVEALKKRDRSFTKKASRIEDKIKGEV